MEGDTEKTMIDVVHGDEAVKLLMSELEKKIKERKQTLEWQLDPSNTLLEYVMFLSGLRSKTTKNDENGDKIEYWRTEKPMMNSRGVITFYGKLKHIVNKDTVLSSIENKQICRILQDFAEELLFEIFFNFREYEMDMNTMWSVKNETLRLAELCLMRAEGARTLQHLETTLKISESSNKQENQKSSAFDRLTAQT